MRMEVLLQITLILAGAVLLGKTLVSLARRRLTESFCIFWGLISVMLILVGILFQLLELAECFSLSGWWFLLAAGAGTILGGFWLSEEVAVLMRRNNELILKVALLDHELEGCRREKNSLCDQYAGESGSGEGSFGDAAQTGSEAG